MTNNLTEDQKTNLDTLIAHLEQLPDDNFYMGVWREEYPVHTCGTVACIGGWCDLLFNIPHNSTYDDTAEKIGLTEYGAERMFFGNGSHYDPEDPEAPSFALDDIDKPMAIAALKDPRRTGKFENWGAYGAKPVMSYGDD